MQALAFGDTLCQKISMPWRYVGKTGSKESATELCEK